MSNGDKEQPDTPCRLNEAVKLLMKATDRLEAYGAEGVLMEDLDNFIRSIHPLECGPMATCATMNELHAERNATLRPSQATPVASRYMLTAIGDGARQVDAGWAYSDDPTRGEPLYATPQSPLAAPIQAHSKSEYRRVTAQGGNISLPKTAPQVPATETSGVEVAEVDSPYKQDGARVEPATSVKGNSVADPAVQSHSAPMYRPEPNYSATWDPEAEKVTPGSTPAPSKPSDYGYGFGGMLEQVGPTPPSSSAASLIKKLQDHVPLPYWPLLDELAQSATGEKHDG